MRAVSRKDALLEAGQAVYWAPRHVPVALADCGYADFSPTGQLGQVISHVQAQGS